MKYLCINNFCEYHSTKGSFHDYSSLIKVGEIYDISISNENPFSINLVYLDNDKRISLPFKSIKEMFKEISLVRDEKLKIILK